MEAANGYGGKLGKGYLYHYFINHVYRNTDAGGRHGEVSEIHLLTYHLSSNFIADSVISVINFKKRNTFLERIFMFKKSGTAKEAIVKILTAVLIASVFLLTMSVLTDQNDSRKQISDDNGATEASLSTFLSGIKGVGEVDVMIQFNDKNAVRGVVVAAQGADDPVVKSSIVKGVATLFDIPASSVMVFEKNRRTE